MLQLETSGSEQKIQALRDRLQGEDDDLQREQGNRRRSGRVAKVNPDLVPLLRGEAVPNWLLSNEIDPPCSFGQTTPRFAIAADLIVTLPLLCVLGIVILTMLH